MNHTSILWVDDEIDLLKSHIIFLNEKGYSVDTCTNGVDALEKVSKKRYEVILLDENMPGLNGIGTLKQIKKTNRNLKVIMITKNEEENIMEEAIGKEISDYLIKPVNPNQILLSLKKTLKDKELIKDSNISEYQKEFRNLSMKMMSLDKFNEWVDFYKELISWELKLSDIDENTMSEILNNQKSEANRLFSKFIEKNYQQWLKSDSGPTLSHNLIKNHLISEINGSPVLFLVIDNLRYDQWKVIESSVIDYYNPVKELSYFSIIPTTTQYSRNSLFAGMMPQEIKDRFPKFWMDDNEKGVKTFTKKIFLNKI